jgi:hypothetical protein
MSKALENLAHAVSCCEELLWKKGEQEPYLLEAAREVVEGVMSHETLMLRIREMSNERPAVKTLLEHLGAPDFWPKHLKAELFESLGVVAEEKIYRIREGRVV